MLDAFLLVLDGRPLPEPSGVPAPDLSMLTGAGSGNGARSWRASAGDEAVDAQGEPGHGVSDLRYEVMYLLSAPDDSIEAFKEVWAGLGDSIVVVGGDGLWNCHIHTNDVGAAIESGLDAGRPRRIRVTDLDEQVEEERWVRESVDAPGAGPSVEGAGPPPTTDVVAVVTGEGIGRIFRSLGVHHLVVGGQTMNPATADLVKAVEAVASHEVVILPNNKNIRPVAERVDALSSKTVRVVATGSIVEGFAALLAYDPAADAEENVNAMTDSAAHVVPAEITQAVRDSSTDAGEVHEGDYIGMSRDGVVAVADSAIMCARLLLSRLLNESHELVTLIEGEGSKVGDTRSIEEWLSEEFPDVALEVHHGGQPLYPYLLGIE
jgi:dihydroxyacetone kinase-like predicted kinase